MKAFLKIIVIIVITSQYACKQNHPTFELVNTGDTILSFKANSTTPSALLVKISGSSSANFYIDHVLLLKGTVDTLLRFDQYTNDVNIKFKNPEKGKNNLLISCKVP